MYGKIDTEYYKNEIIIILCDKKSFDTGMIATIDKYSSKNKEHCYIKNRNKPIGKLYIHSFTNEYDNIMKSSLLPINLTKLILEFITV